MSEKVIELLNAARARELSAITQYMAQHYELEDQGFDKLGDTIKKIAIEEMKHAEDLAERIQFLNGVPTSKPDAIAKKGQEITEMLDTNIDLEAQAVKMYNESANACSSENDQISKRLFEELLSDEEEHLDAFETIKAHIEKLGPAYLATLTGE